MIFDTKKRKILPVILGAGVLGVLLSTTFYFFKKEDKSPEQQNSEFPVSNTLTRPQENLKKNDVLNIQTPAGDVLMLDPRKLPNTTQMGTGIFSITILDNLNTRTFGIIFNESNASFAIGLEEEPIALARLDAEQYLMSVLNVSQEDLCALNIFVGVPYRINQFYSGSNLGLSFCPGSVLLE